MLRPKRNGKRWPSKPSTRSQVVSGTGLGHGSLYWSLTTKVVMGCIPFFCKWEEMVEVGGTKKENSYGWFIKHRFDNQNILIFHQFPAFLVLDFIQPPPPPLLPQKKDIQVVKFSSNRCV